jgi:exosortase E/protease (VPEID-CTERM system)
MGGAIEAKAKWRDGLTMQHATAIHREKSNRGRLVAFGALTLVEIFLTSFSFNFATGLPEWINPVTLAKASAQAVVVALAVLVLIAWPVRDRIANAWSLTMRDYNWRASVIVNLALFAALLAATVAFSELVARSASPPWHWFALYCLLLLATASSLAALAAPLGFWRWLARDMPSQIATAAISGVLLVVAGRLALESWSSLAGWTLHAAYWILSFYETDVVLDIGRSMLGAGDFHVRVTKECSGYEGIGLVTAFLAFYCRLMRRHLRFPHALLLIPIGIAASWTLNAIRIALLISVGTHVSPEVALNGFHSQAGWIAFLGIAIGLMVVSTKSPYFRARSERSVSTTRSADDLLLALLAPFIALMASSIIASLFAPHDYWLYFLKVAAVGGALWHFRRAYASLPIVLSPVALAVGAGIGFAWVLTDPGNDRGAELAAWIATLPAWLAALWLVCRGIGTVMLVPMAEELAFRGYLQRILISGDFERVSPGHFTWLSFVLTSLLFGLTHQRWVAAAIAGALYALLVYRTNRLSDAILAHAASNAVIFIWAVAAHQWTLL